MCRLGGIVLALAWTAGATPVAFTGASTLMLASLPFDGLQDGEQVLEYYNGGFGGLGSGPGPALGVSFSSRLAQDSTVIAHETSALVTAASVTMNLAEAFSGEISFYYGGAGAVAFYTGQDSTGALLNSYALSNPPVFGSPFGATLEAFQSVVFTPAVGSDLRPDHITFGADVVPEPSSASLFSSRGAPLLIAFLLSTWGHRVRRSAAPHRHRYRTLAPTLRTSMN